MHAQIFVRRAACAGGEAEERIGEQGRVRRPLGRTKSVHAWKCSCPIVTAGSLHQWGDLGSKPIPKTAQHMSQMSYGALATPEKSYWYPTFPS